MQGFKSFGNTQVTIKVKPSFTCLIGPNGSGKSNLVDAILFVLGTRSTKTLRADKLKDLLYSGQGGKKPAEECRVDVIFDNSDFAIPFPESEVTVSRELKKKGNSVYRLNGKRISRNEVLEKLKIAGIDLVNGFNVIAQGQVAEIVSMSGEERRQVLEDIAGTSSFDEKKEEALKGLEDAKRRLEELGVLVAEVSQQRVELRSEKERMEKYVALGSEVAELATQVLSKQLFLSREAQEELDARIQELQQELSDIENQKKDKSIEDLNKVLQEQEILVEDLVQELDQQKSETRDLEVTMIRLEEEIKHAKNEIKSRTESREESENLSKSYQEKIERNERREVELSEELEHLASEIDEADQAIIELEDQLEEQRQKYEDLEFQYHDKEREVRKVEQNITQFRVKIDYGQSLVENYEKSLQQKNKQIEGVEEKLKNLREDQQKIQTAITRTEKQKTSTVKEIQQLAEKRGEVEEQVEDRNRQLREMEDELLVLETRLDTIKEFMERSEVNPAFEFIAQQQEGGFYGIYGKLIDLYGEESIPRDVSHLAEAMVVEDVDTAVKLIELLKEKAVGALTFIPRTAFGPLSTQSPSEFVDRIVDRSEISQSIADAAKRWQKNKEKTVVTVEGDVFRPDGTILGGYFAGSAREEFEEVLHQIQELKDNIAKTEAEKDQLHARTQSMMSRQVELTQKVEDVEKSLTNAHRQEGIIQESIRQTEGTLEQLDRDRFPMLTHLEDKQAEILDQSSELEKLEHELASKQQEVEALRADMQEAEVREMELEIQEKRRELTRVENQKVRVETELEVTQRSLDDYRSQMKRLESQLEGNRGNVEGLQKLIDAKEQEVTELQAKIKNDSAEVEDKKKELNEARRELKRVKQEWQNLHMALDEVQERVAELTNMIHELEMDKQRYVVEEERLLKEAEENKTEMSVLSKVEANQISINDLERRINRLVEQQKSLEPVNMRAGQEFERVDKRYTELHEQQEFLGEEQSAIEDFISQIEAEKLNAFMRTYNEISRHFGRIYHELDEGSARMILDNPDEVFEGGIQIEAHPKGKKVRSIEALSGGEKTLCALSFILAIQHVDAQPFYILDEVDASLDPGNVDKLGKLLSRLSRDGDVQGVPRKGAQFIVISHREPLMAKSDLIWGVTTSKGGVSSLVPLDLEDYQEKARELGLLEPEMEAV